MSRAFFGVQVFSTSDVRSNKPVREFSVFSLYEYSLRQQDPPELICLFRLAGSLKPQGRWTTLYQLLSVPTLSAEHLMLHARESRFAEPV